MTSLNGRLLSNTPLSEYTSWRVGGPAKQLYLPQDSDDLIAFLKQLPEKEPLLFLGLGSNTLIRDGGFHGTVIITQGALQKLEQLKPTTVRAEAGVASPAFARFTARHHLSGAEFLAGIPGTIGGALAMNAGCNQQETWQIVQAVEVVNRRGEKKIRYPTDYAIAYRCVQAKEDEFFLAAHFELMPGEKETSLEKIRILLDYRTRTQPTNEPSCGSVFRNPPGQYAARLIEQCGLKGTRIGDAVISEKHANFIVNEGQATAAEIEQLITLIQQTVSQQQNITLIPEVHIVGHP